MATNSSLLQKPVFWVAILGIGGILYISTEGDSTPKAALKPKVSTTKVATGTGEEAVFEKLDRTSSFGLMNDTPRNAFIPVVARRGGIGSGDGKGNEIPTDITGGEGNWVYTGTAETDGQRVALIENRTTNDAVFLKRGERWKSGYVVRISEYSVILSGPNGTKTIGLVDDSAPLATLSRGNRSGTLPPASIDLPPSLNGPIGGRRGGNGLTAIPQAQADQGQPGD